MRRNIIKQGNNSFTLTLPVGWIRENNLSGGEEIELNEEDNKIIISLTKNKPLTTTINIDVKEFKERSLKNIIFQLYRKGYDKIECKNAIPDQVSKIKKIVKNNLLGFEVTEEESSRCVIENVAEPSKDKFFAILNKTFFIIKTNSEEIISDITNGNYGNLSKHLEIKDNFDVYGNFLRRIVIKENIMGSKDSYLLYYFIAQLSYIHHAYYYSYYRFAEKKVKIDDETVKYLFKTRKMTELLYESYTKKDMSVANKIGEEFNKLEMEILDAIDNPKIKSNSILFYMGMCIRSIMLASTVLFGLIQNEENQFVPDKS